MFKKQIALAHTILIIIIIALPHRPINTNTFFNKTNTLIKKYAFFFTLMIRVYYNQCWDKILAEYVLYFISIKNGGTLRAFSIVSQRRLNISGHLFLFSYSCYLFMISILMKTSIMNFLSILVMIFYILLGIRTIIYYHKKSECLISAVNSLIICFLHDFLVNCN